MNKFLFYLLSFTWGLPMTFIGLIVSLVLVVTGHKPKRHGYCWYFEVGEGWGGVELGAIFVANKNPSTHIKNHEHGHAIQNCFLGPLFPFVIAIPSVVRYWYRELKYNRKGATPPTKYDDIWFEGNATKLGTKLIERLGEK